jgi:hypothetical protein
VTFGFVDRRSIRLSYGRGTGQASARVSADASVASCTVGVENVTFGAAPALEPAGLGGRGFGGVQLLGDQVEAGLPEARVREVDVDDLAELFG